MSLLENMLARLKRKEVKPVLVNRNQLAPPPDAVYGETYKLPGSKDVLTRNVREKQP